MPRDQRRPVQVGRRQAGVFVVLVLVAASVGAWTLAAEASEFTFVSFTDPHIPAYGFNIGLPLTEEQMLPMHNQQRLQQFVGECLAMEPRPAFVVNCGDTGDVGWTPLLRLYSKLMQPLVSAAIPIYTIVGNHDIDYAGIGKQGLAEFFDPLGPALIGRHGTRYSFDLDDAHLIFLNNSAMCGCIRLNPMDLAWLHEDLEDVDRDKQVLVFMHAYMTGEDTYQVVEMLQEFRFPVIFRGHAHGEKIGKWGGVPMVVTGALYGGNPKAGSYRVVSVARDRIVMRTRDFAQPAGTLGPEQIAEPPAAGPDLRISEPASDAVVSGTLKLAGQVAPAMPGKLHYSIPTLQKWTSLTGQDGKWEAEVAAPTTPGRYMVAVQFRGDNGAIVWAHRTFKVAGESVREVWGRNLGSAVQGAPANWRDLAIVPTRQAGLYALRHADGEQVWHREAATGEILGRIAADRAAVYYGAGRTVCACDAATGSLLWETTLDGAIVAGVTASSGRLYVPAGERTLHCLDTRDGRMLWEYKVSLPILMEPAATEDTVFFGAMDGYLRALDAATGRELWSRRLSAPEDRYYTASYWTPLVAGTKVIVRKRPARKEENNLLAFDAQSGEPQWSCRAGGFPSRLAASLRQDKVYAYYAEKRGAGVQCLSVEDGAVQWTAATGVGMYAGVAGVGELIVRDGNSVCCVDSATGAAKWVYRASIGPQGWLYGPGAMTVEDDLAIIGTMDGHVFALGW